jgi:hypothetical protein
MTDRLTIKGLHDRIGITPDMPGYGTAFGPRSRAALFAKLSNKKAPALTNGDFVVAASRLGVPVGYIRGVRKIEAPRGPYDDDGRPSILYERHKFRNNTVPVGRFNASNPTLSGPPYGPGGYGAFSAQYGKLADACALDPEAAFRACSWGAFQVLGENATALGYASAYDMAMTLVEGEGGHLDTFVRYVETNHLVAKFQACRAGDPRSCQPFVAGYNGPGYRDFHYDEKLAAAIA